MSRKILGLAGTFASGKDTVANYLEAEHNFTHVSTGDLIRQEVRGRGQSTDRDNLVAVGNELRQEFGSGVLVERAIMGNISAANLVISGIRAIGEGQAVKDNGGKLVFIDASSESRYNRLKSRGRIGDETSLDDFISHETRELTSEKDSNQNILGVRRIADIELFNDKGQDELFLAVRGLLALL